MKTFTSTEIENWRIYERARPSWVCNAFAPQAREATGLTREEYLFVITNFSALSAAAKIEDQK